MESRKPEIPAGFSDPSKPFSGSNGTIPPEKNRFPATKTQYKECLKNHAATMGGHALDGCGEFMPESGDVFKCAACGCHRNFHRRESDPAEHSGGCECFLRPPHLKRGSPSSPYNSAPQMLLALSAGLGEAEEVTLVHQGSNPGARKRFRTKFTQEQKEKMQSFSERVGWKMAKQDDSLIQQFCNEIGVGRTVLKVWMHNNKHAFGRKDSDTTC